MSQILQTKLDVNLKCRNIDMTYFIQKMINRQTSGLEMTLIILAEMFDVVITCVFDKYVWKSKDVPLERSEVSLLLLATGVFASATQNCHYKISVHLPKCVKHLFTVSSDSVTNESRLEQLFQHELAKRGKRM